MLEGIIEMRRAIEGRELPPNLGAALDSSVAEFGERNLCNFFDSGEELTFSEFGERVERMAVVLRRLGVERGDHVAVLLPNIPEFPIAWMALAKLGAVMVPVNTRLTSEEVAFTVDDADVTFVVIESSLFADLDSALDGIEEQRTLVIGGSSDSPRSFAALSAGIENVDLEPVEVGLDDMISIQYTSGTTGLPKGAIQTHRYWLTIAISMIGLFDEPPRRILTDTPFFYMDPQFEFLAAMMSGSEVFVAARPSLSRFIERIRDHRIDYCSFWENALSLPPDERDTEHELRWVSTTGLPGARHAELEERFGVVARDLYGMTEIGMGLFLPWEATAMVGSGSCGVPAPFREIKIVDEEMNELGSGEAGELMVRGEGMFLGYYKRPEANAELLTDDGWFHTGDLMTRDDEGFHYFVGRKKDMIRRSHENISAVEVEAILERMPEVREAAVIAVPDDFRGEEVKALLVPAEGIGQADLSPAEVDRFCRLHLAAFKLPRYIEFRESLPKTASGKIAKGKIRKESGDPVAGSFDIQEGVWL